MFSTKPSTVLVVVFSLMLACISIQSCTDSESIVHGEVTEDNFFQNEQQFNSALGNAYTSLYGYMNNGGYFGVQEITSDEGVIPVRTNGWHDGGIWIELHTHNYTPDTPAINTTWNFCYSGINAANRVIFQLQEAGGGGEQTDQFVAELKVLRALYYYFLVDTFGNVPIIDTFDVPEGFAPANNTRQEVYDFIEKEITENIDMLSKEVGQSTYGRMHYYAAQSLLAKLYLNAEIYTGTPQWSKVVEATNEIINSGQYSLAADFFDNFATENSGSPENIFSIPYDHVFAQGNNIHIYSWHYANQQTHNLASQPWNGFSTYESFYNSFEDNDVRKGSFLVGPQTTPSGEPAVDPAVEPEDPDGKQVVLTPEFNTIFQPGALKQSGARVGKYEVALGSTANLDNDVPIFRYGDILLMKAEALWRMDPDDPEALRLVNMIRKRADVDPFNSLSADKLLAERGREMFVELYRRQDQIRFETYTEGNWDFKDPDQSNHVKLFPIPQDQLDANPNLKQNPGY